MKPSTFFPLGAQHDFRLIRINSSSALHQLCTTMFRALCTSSEAVAYLGIPSYQQGQLISVALCVRPLQFGHREGNENSSQMNDHHYKVLQRPL
jgi:hypothetical protein